MPPCYPQGGMANPLLAYTSQTTIVGDKSQEYVLIRNVAQMWTGAQVTPNNWEDAWINEGFTTYVERMVEAQLFSLSFATVETFVANNSLARQIGGRGLRNQTYSTLHPVLLGNNPSDAFSVVPYEKGFHFLWWLEQ